MYYICIYLGTYIDLYVYIHIQHDWNCWNTFSQWDCSCPNTHVGILSSLGCLAPDKPRMATRETQQVTDKFYDGNLSDLEPSRVATSYYSQMAARDISWNCSIQFLQFLPLYSFHFNQFTPSGNLFPSRLLHLLFGLSIQLCYCASNLQTTTKSPH